MIQFKTTSVKLLPPPQLSCHLSQHCSSARFLSQVHSVPKHNGIAEDPSAVFVSHQLQLGSGQERAGKGVGKGLFPKQRNPPSRWVSKVNYQKHTPFHIYFFRCSLENCHSLLSAAIFSSPTLLLVLGESAGNAGTIGTHSTAPSPRQPFLHLLHTFREQSCARYRSSSHSATEKRTWYS